jgi:hypothetical protein
MFRNLISFALVAAMVTCTDVNVWAARKPNNGTANGKTTAADKRREGGMLHVSVRNPRGRPAGHALVRVISRGTKGHRHSVARRTGPGGHVNIEVAGRSFVVRARGARGEHGSAAGGMGGRAASVMVQLHGGRRVVGGGVVVDGYVVHRGRVERYVAHRHQAWGLGIHHPHAARPGGASHPAPAAKK